MARLPEVLKTDNIHPYLWKSSLACFILAGLTGFLYRLGMIGWLPVDLWLENIRHAHSHLMFFGWAVPFPLYILMVRLNRQKAADKTGISWMKYSLAGALFFGLLAYPFFLFYGYHPVAFGSFSLPLSVICSGMVMVCWYGFMIGYLTLRKALDNSSAQLWIDGSLLMLLVCSLGAWGVAVVQFLDPSNYLFLKSLTHFFLATFTEGWIVIVVIAIIIIKVKLKPSDWVLSENISLGCIVLGAPMTFPYGISESLLTPLLLNVARVGGLLTAFGLSLFIYAVASSGKWRRAQGIWKWPLALLTLKGVMQVIASLAPSAFWFADHGLRIFYLHVLLLGAFTLAMTGWLQIQVRISGKYYNIIIISILTVLATLIFPTSLWPVGWSGNWIFYLLGVTALLPVLAIALQWLAISQSNRTFES